MGLAVLLGGARSGKSSLAVEIASGTRKPVTFIATAEPRDEEMAERIAQHRAERPEDWRTVEEPHGVEDALRAADPKHVVIVDCLSLWVANLLEQGEKVATVFDRAATAAALAAARRELTIAVSNEVGLGVVPATPLGRSYRDLLGSVNRVWVAQSASAALVVAGRALLLSETALPVITAP